MSLIQLLVIIVVLSLVYFLAMRLAAKLPPPFGNVVQIVVILLAILWLLSLVGLLPGRMRFSANGENRTREILVGNETPYHWATFASVPPLGIEPSPPVLQTGASTWLA
jgi:hypothetical protein